MDNITNRCEFTASLATSTNSPNITSALTQPFHQMNPDLASNLPSDLATHPAPITRPTSLPSNHKSMKPRRRTCSISGCTNGIVQGGLCVSHGAKRRTCRFPNCTKNSKNAGLCSKHGPARKRCEHPACPNVAVRGGVCKSHGAWTKPCSVEGCSKVAAVRGMCKRHHIGAKNARKEAVCVPVSTDNNTVSTVNSVDAVAPPPSVATQPLAMPSFVTQGPISGSISGGPIPGPILGGPTPGGPISLPIHQALGSIVPQQQQQKTLIPSLINPSPLTNHHQPPANLLHHQPPDFGQLLTALTTSLSPLAPFPSTQSTLHTNTTLTPPPPPPPVNLTNFTNACTLQDLQRLVAMLPPNHNFK